MNSGHVESDSSSGLDVPPEPRQDHASPQDNVPPDTVAQQHDAALWQRAAELRPYLKAVVAKVLAGNLGAKVDDSDIVQRAMATALEKREQFKGDNAEQWQAWLVAIARNEAREAYRYWGQQRRDVERECSLDDDAGRNESSNPQRNLQRRERAARLLVALEQLSESDRTIIHLRNFQVLSHAAIATELGITEAAARRRWCDALRRLRDKLGDSSG